MAEPNEPMSSDAAEKAYAAAAEAVSAVPATPVADLPVTEAAAPEAPVEFPAKARRARKPVATPVKQPEAKAEPAPAKKAPARKPAAKKIQAGKPKAAPTVSKKTKTAPAKPAAAPSLSQLKDKIMASKKTPDFTEGFKTVVADAQAKAQEAFEKSTAAFGEAGEFAKGNVEAIVESGKILASGLQEIGTELVAEAKSAFETISADAKEFATIKSPADFLKLQSELMRRNFDAAMAFGSKNSEAVMKLANDAFAPISGRVSLAVEKVKKAA